MMKIDVNNDYNMYYTTGWHQNEKLVKFKYFSESNQDHTACTTGMHQNHKSKTYI